MPAGDSLVHIDDRSSVPDAVNRIVWRDRGNTRYPAQVVWRSNSSEWILDIDNAAGKHMNVGGRLTVEDAQVRVDQAPLEIRSGNELRFFNAGNTNSTMFKHSGTNDVTLTVDGLWIGAALNVGASIVATVAGSGSFDSNVNIRNASQLVFNNAGNSNTANLYHSGTNDVLKSDDGLWLLGALNVGSAIVATVAGSAQFAAGVQVKGALNVGAAVNATVAGSASFDSTVDIRDAGALRFINAGNIAQFNHQGTPDVIATPDGLRVGAALNVAATLLTAVPGSAALDQYVKVNGTSVGAVPITNSLYADNVPKVIVLCDGAGNMNWEFNVYGVTKPGVGRFVVTFRAPFAAAVYVVNACVLGPNPYFCHTSTTGYTVGQCEVNVRTIAGALVDPNNLMVTVFGPQA